MEKFLKLKSVLILGFAVIILPFFVRAVSLGSEGEFFVEQNYDVDNREQILAKLKKISNKAYFYIESDWWDDLTTDQKNEYSVIISDLADKFDDEIYPVMTETFGHEWKSGIDADYKITVLFHETEGGVAGYFRSVDEFTKMQASNSNEREMVYLSGEVLGRTYPESYLAHEFMHLITFNQKNKINLVEEEVWLNELRAEYAPTLLGYDDKYAGTNLQQRIKDFTQDPNNNLIDWQGESVDYGVINLFGQYLVEQFGIEVLADSLKSEKIGLASLNYVLNELGVDKNIEEIFTDWQIAISANDCEIGEEYCYQNQFLGSIKAVPSLIYLPSTQEAHFSLIYSIQPWSGHWYKIVGGNKSLKVEFTALDDGDFIIPYFIEQDNRVQELKFLEVKNGKGIIEIPYFGQDGKSITLVPGTMGENDDYRFSLDIYTFSTPVVKTIDEMTEEELMAKILEIQQLLNNLLIQLQQLKAQECLSINQNLYFGMVDSSEVKCLQQLLVDEEVYPEAIVNGNFFTLTQDAVIKFQNKYKSEILTPVGLSVGTGYVGSMTLGKINQLLSK